jgi:hypothetical protein
MRGGLLSVPFGVVVADGVGFEGRGGGGGGQGGDREDGRIGWGLLGGGTGSLFISVLRC